MRRKFPEASLDDIASLIGSLVVPNPLLAVGLARDHDLDFSLFQISAKRIGVIGFVGEQLLDPRNQADAVFCKDAIGSVAGGQDEGPRPEIFVDKSVYLAVSATLRDPDGLKLAPFSAAGAAVCLDMGTVQGDLAQWLGGCGDRLEYLLPDATIAPSGEAIVDGLRRSVFRGQSTQRQPIFGTCMIPLRTHRLSWRCGPGRLVGSKGSIFAHWSSVNQKRRLSIG